jgi:hypothetical protein
MDKQDVLKEISRLSAEGELSQLEIQQAYDAGNEVKAAIQHSDALSFTKHVTAVQILYYFGGMVAFIGVTILLAQNWDSLPDVVKILSTAVLGAALLSGGVWLTKDSKLAGVGQAFILAGSLIFPVGIYVILKLAYIDITNSGINSLVAAAIAAIFLAGYWQFRKILLLIFGIAWTTACYFLLGSFLLQGDSYLYSTYFEYRIIIAAVSYLLIAYYFSNSSGALKRLTGILNGVGVIGFLGAGFALSLDSHIWEAIFPLLALGAMLGSVKVHSRIFLFAGALALIGYIFQITGKYFAESVGWPVALIIAGFALIGIGYFAVQVNKKYFTKN